MSTTQFTFRKTAGLTYTRVCVYRDTHSTIVCVDLPQEYRTHLYKSVCLQWYSFNNSVCWPAARMHNSMVPHDASKETHQKVTYIY